jgi:hypothetical protein
MFFVLMSCRNSACVLVEMQTALFKKTSTTIGFHEGFNSSDMQLSDYIFTPVTNEKDSAFNPAGFLIVFPIFSNLKLRVKRN